MADRETQIIILDDEGTDYAYNRESYELADFGGVVPSVGDLITYAGVRQGLDRTVMSNRRVRQVIRRYFAPDQGTAKIYLVVTSRPGVEVERNALGD